MKKLLIALLFVTTSLFAQAKTETDSTLIDFQTKLELIQKDYQNRLMQIAETDPVCNQLRGASAVLEQMRKEYLERKTKKEQKK